MGSESSGERRRSLRYKCSDGAQFRIEASDFHTWGTLTDISQNGCWVELMASFPVGANVDRQLELSGIRTHVKGEVRVSYPGLGMGIAFRDIPTRIGFACSTCCARSARLRHR